jgi:hypothetical protein
MPYGMSFFGKWAEAAPRDDHRQNMLLYLPWVLSLFPRYPSSSPVPMPFFALTLWGFSELFKRRSVVLYEYLRRKLLNSFFTPSSPKDAIVRYPDLRPHENELLSQFNKELLQPNGELVQSVRACFGETFRPSTSVAKNLPSLKKMEVLPSNVLSACVVWRVRQWKNIAADILKVRPKPDLSKVKGKRMLPPFKSDILHELMFLRQIPANSKTVFGVRRSTHIYPEARITMVNMGEFAEYRHITGSPFYKRWRNILKVPKTSNWKMCATELANHFRSNVPGLEPPNGDYKRFDTLIEDAFGEVNLDHILFIPQSAMVAYIKRFEMVAHMKGTAPKPKRATGSPTAAIIESPPIKTASFQTFRFSVVRRGRSTFFGVPWEVSTRRAYKQTATGPQRRKGVMHDLNSNKLYFTYDFLKQIPGSPLLEHPSLDEWLFGYHTTTPEQFKELLRHTRSSLVNPSERKAGHRKHFVTEEDEAIIKYYRPGMTEHHKNELLRICKGRSWNAIANRAASICKARLRAGETDIRNLPHRNYNARLRKAIAANNQNEVDQV